MNKRPHHQGDDRRPGLTEIIDRIQKVNPHWPENRVRSEAKQCWHSQRDDSAKPKRSLP